jgi:NADH-quinone oxidoreductase subunit N
MTTAVVPSDYMPALPEIWMMATICVTLLASLFAKKDSPLTYLMSQFVLLGAAICTWYSFTYYAAGHAGGVLIFHNQFVLDPMAAILKLFIYLIVFVTFLYSRQYNRDRNIPPEFYVLGLISTLGMMILISGHDLIPIYMGIELFSLPTYAMVALERRQGRCIEAAMKYFIIGALASGILLYGLSLMFGMTKSLDITMIAHSLATLSGGSLVVMIVALVFVFAGVAFKFGAAPFHNWVPDVYDGTSTSVTLFISTAPKIAAFALAVRLIFEAMPELHVVSQDIFIVLAVLSIAIGNVVALVQTSLKRMLAYSSIAHIGYMLLGFAAMTKRGEAAAMFYIITYAISTLVSFGMLAMLSRAGFEADKIEDFAGLSSRNPWLAFVMMMVIFSMAGIPPFVGFIAKVGVLEAVINVHLVWLAVLALVFAIIGAYYYLRVVKAMYFEEPAVRTPMACALDNKIIMSLNGLAVLLLGIFPGGLFAMCHMTFQSMS